MDFLSKYGYTENEIFSVKSGLDFLSEQGYAYSVRDLGNGVLKVWVELPKGLLPNYATAREQIQRIFGYPTDRIKLQIRINAHMPDGKKTHDDVPEFSMIQRRDGRHIVLRLRPPQFKAVIETQYDTTPGISVPFEMDGERMKLRIDEVFTDDDSTRFKHSLKRAVHFVKSRSHYAEPEESFDPNFTDVTPEWLLTRINESGKTKDMIATESGATPSDITNFSTGVKPMSKVRRACFWYYFRCGA